MADQKISQLPTITGANMADNDKFVLVDTSGDATVATTRAEFFKSVPDVTFGDSDKAIFGAGSDLQIYHNGVNTFIENTGEGNLYLRVQEDDKDVKIQADNGSGGLTDYFRADGSLGQAQMYYYGSQRLNTSATGINVTGTVTADGLTVDAGTLDTVATFQSSDQFADLALTDSGGTSFIRQSNGSLILEADRANASASSVALIKVDGSQVARFASGGDISFYEDTGTTAKFFWDSAAESLGIGTDSPVAKLHIENGDMRIEKDTKATIGFRGHTTGSTALAFRDASAAVDRMTIDSSGNTHIGGTTSVTTAVTGDNVAPKLIVEGTTATGIAVLRQDTSIVSGNSLGSLGFYGTDTTSNTPTPLAAVQALASGTHAAGDNPTGLRFFTTPDNSSTMAEAMRIDESGNVSIGKTNVLISAVGIHFTPEGTVSATKDGAIPLVLNRVATGSNNPNGVIAQFRRETVTVGNISVSDGATAFNTSSDYRLKENVVELTSASERVNQLRPSRFNWISDDTNTVIDGFIAHEVATVVPEAITGAKDAMIDEEYEVTPEVLDEDGNVTTEAVMGTRSVPDYQGIDQSKLVPLLTAALKEALAEIASLKTRVEALEG